MLSLDFVSIKLPSFGQNRLHGGISRMPAINTLNAEVHGAVVSVSGGLKPGRSSKAIGALGKNVQQQQS